MANVITIGSGFRASHQINIRLKVWHMYKFIYSFVNHHSVYLYKLIYLNYLPATHSSNVGVSSDETGPSPVHLCRCAEDCGARGGD